VVEKSERSDDADTRGYRLPQPSRSLLEMKKSLFPITRLTLPFSLSLARDVTLTTPISWVLNFSVLYGNIELLNFTFALLQIRTVYSTCDLDYVEAFSVLVQVRQLEKDREGERERKGRKEGEGESSPRDKW